MMTYRGLKKEGLLFSKDAERLLFGLKDWSLTDWLMHCDEETDDNFTSLYLSGLRRLAAREPLQHILGKAPFYGRDFSVCGDVLIPRFDTETLIECVLAQETSPEISLLDLCTGSGCIAITLFLEGAARNVDASDISLEALKTAKMNAETLRASVSFIESDMFENLPDLYDVIVSNPPYIKTGDIASLDPEVKDHDPLIALDGGDDGLLFYRRIAEEAKHHLKDGGRLYMEIGDDQGQEVSEIFKSEGFRNVRVVKDLAERDRVVLCSTDLKIS